MTGWPVNYLKVFGIPKVNTFYSFLNLYLSKVLLGKEIGR